MKLTQLIYFLETARHEHVGKAAQILAISPSAISHSIAALEREFGKDLFIKNGKNIQLTNFGKIMAERAEYILQTTEKIKRELLSGTVELQGHYSLAASHMLSEHFLTPSWISIQKAYPHLTSEIYSLRSSDVVQKVSRGELDFGICFNPQSNPNFEEEVLHEGQLILVVRANHPILEVEPSEQPQRLSQSYPAILPKSFQGISNCETHPIFKAFHMQQQETLLFDNYAVAFQAIAQSDAWGLIPDILLKITPISFGSIIPAGWEAPMKISAIWPRKRLITNVLNQLSLKVKHAILSQLEKEV
ncbi:LysR family transcriptional regulator [Candidatus Paracaedibacter symbiosus]|uniref:LysR family transcriptional regulator n=1 Tax=Candidatus Paracaedibacter symbiosus TaxID=244582 RepID=UPI000509BADD|nr:LysR family transcriptional regulator [Candidatus Paracaedibacter symbiosus]